jgi:hypothetical protein
MRGAQNAVQCWLIAGQVRFNQRLLPSPDQSVKTRHVAVLALQEQQVVQIYSRA